MTNYALIRVSDDKKQDLETQKHAIKSYCSKNNVEINKWHEFRISGSKFDRTQRGITHVINLLQPGDHLITTDLPRLGRESVSDLMEIVLKIINRGATLHFCYSGETLSKADQNSPSKLFTTLAESWSAWHFAVERSQKAKSAIDRRRKAGLHNGRKQGSYVKSKLDAHEHTIISMKNDGLSEYRIAEHFNVERTTLRSWLKRRNEIIRKAQELKIWQLGMSITDLKIALNKQL